MWILIVYIFAGSFAHGDSVTVTSVPGFQSQATCIAAAKQLEPFVAGSSKEIRSACVKL